MKSFEKNEKILVTSDAPVFCTVPIELWGVIKLVRSNYLCLHFARFLCPAEGIIIWRQSSVIHNNICLAFSGAYLTYIYQWISIQCVTVVLLHEWMYLFQHFVKVKVTVHGLSLQRRISFL